MLGYQTSLDKSMNGIKTLSDGSTLVSNGVISCTSLTTKNLNAANISVTGDISANNIYGIIKSSIQNSITSLGTLISF